MLVNLIACSFFALVYIHTREREQDQAINKMQLLMWMIGVPANLGVAATFSMNLEFLAIKRDLKEGSYRLASYIFANTLIQIPLMLTLAAFAISVGGYGIGAWNGAGYGQMLLIFTATLWSFECIAQFFSVACHNPLNGMMQFMQVWFAAFLFAGVMVPEADVIWPLRVLCKVLPLKYAIRGMAFVEIHGTTWKGAVLDAAAPRGFTCPEDPSYLECYGRTGAQVLETLGANFKSISSSDTVMEDLFVICMVSLVFKLLFVAAASYRSRGARPLSAA